MQYKTIILLLAVLFVLSESRPRPKLPHERNDDRCPNSLMMSCSAKIKKVVLECSSEDNAKDCVSLMLKGSRCHNCIDKVLPHFSEVESFNRAKDRTNKNVINQEEKDINEILHSYATCGVKQLFQCKAKIKRVHNRECEKAADTHNCMIEKLQKDQCHICICTVFPGVCNKEDIEQEKHQRDVNEKESMFDLLSGIGEQFAKRSEERGEKREPDSFGMFGKLGNLAQNKGQFEKMKDMASALEMDSDAQKQNDQLTNLQNMMGAFMQDPTKTQKLLNDLQLDEADFEGDDQSYEDIQQKITERIMENPTILQDFIYGEDKDKAQRENIKKLVNEDNASKYDANDQDDDDDEDSESTESDDDDQEDISQCKPEIEEGCKWKILKILPSCVAQKDTRTCLESILRNSPCFGCVCKVVPESC